MRSSCPLYSLDLCPTPPHSCPRHGPAAASHTAEHTGCPWLPGHLPASLPGPFWLLCLTPRFYLLAAPGSLHGALSSFCPHSVSSGLVGLGPCVRQWLPHTLPQAALPPECRSSIMSFRISTSCPKPRGPNKPRAESPHTPHSLLLPQACTSHSIPPDAQNKNTAVFLIPLPMTFPVTRSHSYKLCLRHTPEYKHFSLAPLPPLFKSLPVLL